MAQGRGERKKTDRPADEVRFAPLGEARWEDSGYLPPDDDQSWREMEALRIAAYDRIGHLPPQDDQSWREREAMRIAAAQEDGEAEAPVVVPEPPLLVPEPRRGSGGVLFLLGGFVGLVILVLAVPDVVSPDFWRAQWTSAPAKPVTVAARTAHVPASAPPPIQAQSPDTQPPASALPSVTPPPPVTAEAAPGPQMDARASSERSVDDKTMVIRQDGTVKFESPSAASKPDPARPAPQEDAEVDGVYAMAPGPDGILRRQFFPSKPQSGSRPAAHAKTNAKTNDPRAPGGVYAMAPGPDGKLKYQYFPPKP